MALKVGDKRTVRNDLVLGKQYGNADVHDSFVQPMNQLCGKTVTISLVTDNGKYLIKECPGGCKWTEDMFEEEKHMFEVGDFVKGVGTYKFGEPICEKMAKGVIEINDHGSMPYLVKILEWSGNGNYAGNSFWAYQECVSKWEEQKSEGKVMNAKTTITVNGKDAEIELTKEQMDKLGLKAEEVKVDPFARAKRGDEYYYIDTDGDVEEYKEDNDSADNGNFSTANYCTDKSIMEQRTLHETLSRLLWRFAMQNGGVPEIGNKYWYVRFSGNNPAIDYWYGNVIIPDVTRFISFETAQRAIDEIIKPFLAAHPDFKW